LKVLLINPPSVQEIMGNLPEIVEEERGYNPPLGILYLAAYLEQQNCCQVEVIDAQVEELSYPQLKEKIRQSAPDVVGITAMTFTLLDVLHTVKIVKEVSAESSVVIGGPHAHLYPEETLNLPGIDYVILGEGELAFAQLMNALGRPEALRKIKGLVFRENGNIVNNGPSEIIQDLDALPFPARHLVPYKRYSSVLAKRTPITTMFTSRGCPYRCAFCDRPHLGKRFRARSPKNVVDEMEACVALGIYEFLLYDDTFTVDKQRVLAICEEIQRRNLSIGWDIRARVDTVTPDMLKALRSAGCERIHYGVEAGTDKILKVLNKRITIEQVKETFRWTRRAGISTLAYFMIGSPTETRDDISETFRLAKALDPDYVHLAILTPYPGTQIYFDALAQGVFKEDYWQAFAAQPTADFKPRYWEVELSTAELMALLDDGYKSFYLRPRYALRQLMQVKSLGEFWRKTRAALKVVKL